jgi:2,3-bisphosphoglycerate-dependent phosphoglycerate mutase
MASTFGALDVLLIRHAEPVPVGTPDVADDDRPLTDAGRAAAVELAAELDGWELTAIYSSPYTRAVETVQALADRRRLPIQLLDDLRERQHSTELHDTWRETLERSWNDPDFTMPGGESGRAAQRRAIATLDLLRVRHPDGNLISLILHSLEPGVDFEFHMGMPMPAIYRLTHDGLRWRIMGGHGFTPIEDGAGDA